MNFADWIWGIDEFGVQALACSCGATLKVLPPQNQENLNDPHQMLSLWPHQLAGH